MLLSYSLNATPNLLLEMLLLHVNPQLQKFIESKGEFTSTNNIKIVPGGQLTLGGADGTTGFPRYIKGIGSGIGQVGNRSTISFRDEKSRGRYCLGIRNSFYELTRAYKLATSGSSISMPFIILFKSNEVNSNLCSKDNCVRHDLRTADQSLIKHKIIGEVIPRNNTIIIQS